MALLNDDQRAALDRFGRYMSNMAAGMAQANQPREGVVAPSLGGLLGQGMAYADKQQRARAEQQAMNRLREMRADEMRAQMEQRRRQQEAYRSLLNPEPTVGPRSVQEAVMPGPGGMASGGRAGPSQQQVQLAREAQQPQGLLGGLSEQERGLLQAMGPEAGLPLLAEQVFAEPAKPKMFTVKEGNKEVTYVGHEGDPSTWRKVSEASRWQPNQGRAPKTRYAVVDGRPGFYTEAQLRQATQQGLDVREADSGNRPQVKGVPRDVFEGLSAAEQKRLLGVDPQSDVKYSDANVAVKQPGGGYEKMTGRVNSQTARIEVMNEQGEYVPAPPGSLVIGTNLTGSEEETGLTNSEMAAYRKLTGQIPMISQLQSRIREGLQSGNFVGGIGGSVVRGLNSLRSQAEAIARQSGDDVNLSLENYQDELQGMAGASNQVKSGLIHLAYMQAKAQHGEDRVTDQDVRLMMDGLGMETNDPEIIMRRVNEAIDSMKATIRGRANAMGIDVPDMSALDQEDSGGGAANVDNPQKERRNRSEQDILRQYGVED